MIFCHCCGREIYGCTGTTSFPKGDPLRDPEFHCDRCSTFQILVVGEPCHVTQGRTQVR